MTLFVAVGPVRLAGAGVTGFNGEVAPIAAFSLSPSSGAAPLTVSITNTSSFASSYLWSVTGGSLSSTTDAEPTWTVSSAGTFSITLAATGPGGTSQKTASATATSGVVPSADWVNRSTAAGVVWAHNFTYAAEVSAHKMDASAQRTIYGVRQAVDESGETCLEQIIVGAKLAQAYTAGSATMVIDDVMYWPDPATHGQFYVMVATPGAATPTKNLFLVTARSGTTLSVTYVPQTLDPFTSTQMSYSAGAYVGNEDVAQWVRVFSALPATENGLPTDDRADGGAVPLRSKSASGTYGVPRDLDLWGYGNYGHANNQSTWQNWTPWQGASTKTPRGPQNGAAAKYGLWDGDEFFIQFRAKIDPRFVVTHRYPSASGRKTWAIINEISTYNELVAGMAPGEGPYDIPSTIESPVSIATNKAAAVVGRSDILTRTNPSDQYGGAWHVAPYYANRAYGGGPLPSEGCNTPDGSAAWEQKAGEWVTFYIRVKPGRSQVAETEFDVKIARTEHPSYDGTYTTLISLTDVKLTYSGSGDYQYPDGAFSYPTVTTMNALPGFQAFWLFGYLNIWQTWNIPPPPASYYYRLAQVIFSRQAIAPPSSDAPTWLPAAGELATLTQSNGKLLNYWRNAVSPYYSAFYSKTIVNDYAGALKNPYWGAYGCTMWFGGGHATGTNDNSVIIAEYGRTGITFKRIVDPTNWAAYGGQNEGGNPSIAGQVAFPWLESSVEGKPLGVHSWQSQVLQPPGVHGGARYGTFWQVLMPGAGQAGYNALAAYKLPLTSTTLNTATWARGSTTSDYPANTAAWGAPPLCAYAPTLNRTYLTTNNTANVRWLDMTTGTYGTGTKAGFAYYNHDGNPAGNGVMMHVAWRDIIVCAYKIGGVLRIEYMSASDTDPTVYTATLSSSLPLPITWSMACACPDNRRIIVGGVSGETSAVYEITVPSTLTNTWTVTRAPFGAGQTLPAGLEPSSNANCYGKFDYDARIKAIVYMPAAQHTGDDTVYVYRPRGV